MQRIALLHYSAPPVIGEVENMLVRHSWLMLGAGHRVSILTGQGSEWNPTVPLIEIPLLDRHYPDVLAVQAFLKQGLLPLRFEELIDEISGHLYWRLAGVDVLIAHTGFAPHMHLALAAALQRLVQLPDMPRLILWHHDLGWTSSLTERTLHDGYPWTPWNADWPSVQHVVGTESQRRELSNLLQIDPERIAVVPDDLDRRAQFNLDRRTSTLLCRMRIASAGPILFFPTWFTPDKRLEWALRLLAALRQSQPGAVLIINGPPEPYNTAPAEMLAGLLALREVLELRGAVHFTAEYGSEPLPESVVTDLCRLADVLLVPNVEATDESPYFENAPLQLPAYWSRNTFLHLTSPRQGVLCASPHADPGRVASFLYEQVRSRNAVDLCASAWCEIENQRLYDEHLAPLLEG